MAIVCAKCKYALRIDAKNRKYYCTLSQGNNRNQVVNAKHHCERGEQK